MQEILKNKTLRWFLLLAILIRIILMPFFFHPDIRVYHSQSQYLKSGVINIYSYLEDNKENHHFKEEFVYFPLAYLFLGTYQLVVSPFLGSEFYHWLNGENTDYLYRYLFVLKLPYLFLDLFIAFLIYKLFEKKRNKELAFTFWLFNPFSIAIIYFYSNIDILAVFFTILSLLFLKKKQSLHAGLSLAIGAGIKAYPILLLPVLFLTKGKFKNQLINFVVSLAVFVLILLPFMGSDFFNASLSSGLTNRIFEHGVDIGLPKKIPYYLIVYSIAFLYLYINRIKGYWLFFLSSTLLLVTMVDYHIQWILWFLPFLIILTIRNSKYIAPSLVIMILSFVAPLLINDRYLSVSLLTPISQIFHQASYPYIFVSKIMDVGLLTNLVKIILFIVGLLTVFVCYKNEKITN